MTERLYYHDAYAREFDAAVVGVDAVSERPGHFAAVLDRTAFYPTSGGQPFDVGRLGDLPVVDVVEDDDGTVRHVVAPAPVAQDSSPASAVSVAVGVRGITMPDLVGKTRQQAETLLQRAGATNVTFIDAGTPPRGQGNRVQSQSVPANTGVGADAAITVSVYGG